MKGIATQRRQRLLPSEDLGKVESEQRTTTANKGISTRDERSFVTNSKQFQKLMDLIW